MIFAGLQMNVFDMPHTQVLKFIQLSITWEQSTSRAFLGAPCILSTFCQAALRGIYFVLLTISASDVLGQHSILNP